MIKTKNKTTLLALTGLFAAIICVATAFLKIPAPLGYIHLGDGMIFLAAAFLGPYGIISAAVGSCLADIIAGYVIYAPVTFVIKGLMALVAWLFIKKFSFKLLFNIIGFTVCELIMLGGYLIFECIMYTPAGAIGGIPGSLVQGGFGIIIGAVSVSVYKKYAKNIKTQ